MTGSGAGSLWDTTGWHTASFGASRFELFGTDGVFLKGGAQSSAGLSDGFIVASGSSEVTTFLSNFSAGSQSIIGAINSAYSAGGGGGTGADPNASYIVVAATASLPNERSLFATNGIIAADGGAGNPYGISIDDSVVATLSGSTFTGNVHFSGSVSDFTATGSVKFNSGLSGSLTRLTDDTSYLVAGTGISITSASNGQVTIINDGTVGDITSVAAGTGLSGGGSSGAVSLALDVSELLALGATVDNSDYVVIEDVTDNSTKKVLVSNLPSSGGSSLTSGFQAYMSSNQSVITSTATVQFNSEQFDIGSDFNTSTYTFTAPSTGKYLFNVLLWLNTIQSAGSYYDLTLVTSNRTYSLVSLDPGGFDTNVAYYTMQGHLLADMDASDTASVSILQGGGVSGTTTVQATNFGLRASLFTGYLVG
jgi:hypothetical protein